MLKMNYSDYENKTWEQVCKEATRRGIMPFLPSQDYALKKREDIIGEIIAHDAYHEGRNDVMRIQCNEPVETSPVENENRRIAYKLQVEGREPIYLKLTPSQSHFAEWCFNSYINFNNATFDEIDGIEYVSP